MEIPKIQLVVTLRTKFLGRGIDVWSLTKAFLPEAKLVSGDPKCSIRIEVLPLSDAYLLEVLSPSCHVEPRTMGSYCLGEK